MLSGARMCMFWGLTRGTDLSALRTQRRAVNTHLPSPPRLTHAAVRECKASDGKKNQGNGLAGRNPKSELRKTGKSPLRNAERQSVAPAPQLPPRKTRNPEPPVDKGSRP